jgi:hypothetical protein
MKTKIWGMACLSLFLWSSCKEKSVDSNQLKIQTNPFADPDEFVGNHKAKVMVLGVFHFDNPGLDDYQETFNIDILSNQRQNELDTILLKLGGYNPTKILIEANRIKNDSLFVNWYSDFLNDRFQISDKRNEIFQVGFKLAKKIGHKRLYAIDAKANWCGEEMDWDNYDGEEYQKSLGQYQKANRYDYEKVYRASDSLKSVLTLLEHFVMTNNPKNRLKDHQAYLTNTVLEGAGDNYIGASSLSRWYQRNIKIFSNVYDITDFEEEERLLIIIGAGHVWQLRQLFKDSPDYDYIEVNKVLLNNNHNSTS